MIAMEQWSYITSCNVKGCRESVYRHTDGSVRQCEHKAYRRWELAEILKKLKKKHFQEKYCRELIETFKGMDMRRIK